MAVPAVNSTENGKSVFSGVLSEIHVDELNPNTILWKLTGRLIVKSQVYEWGNESAKKRSFSIFLLDDHGKEIRCTFYDKFCSVYHEKLKINCIYSVGNCKIVRPNQNYNDFKYTYELRFVNKSFIELNETCDIDKFKIPFNFINIPEILKLDEKTVVDCIGIIWSIGDLEDVTTKDKQKTYKKRELELIDDKQHSITLNIWGNDAVEFDMSNESKIVACRRVKVHVYDKIKSLTTLPSSVLDFIYEGPPKEVLKAWVNQKLDNDSTSNKDSENLDAVHSSGLINSISDKSSEVEKPDNISDDKSAGAEPVLKKSKLNHTI